ncbi:adenosine deaminase family protein [Micromonospora sp. PLK6-60]|uniref:adenosine deaminase family protein n=1 Tax=Micromonospora sp. PLK6-60 TaxID=2873383 RepID=UPI001CA6319A|nr:adenosine deaminase family protein [Micromonospora sp. PLK6-60]MBY8870358.1 adenosine deaminase family protein [Micromonospora sp. PLK6-60]
MLHPAQRTAPKIELHVHLEGTLRPALLAEFTGDGPPAPGPPYAFTDLYGFIEIWNRVTACLRGPEQYRRALLAYAAEAAGHGAVYLEPIVDAEERLGGPAAWADVLAACCDAAAEARERHGVEIGLTPQVCRGHDVEVAEEAARVATRFAGRGVVGFGLSGAEGRFPTLPYAGVARIARDGGLPFVPHAGEAAGPAAVREVLAMGAVRIRHGVRAVEDPRLVDELAAAGTVLDVTPTSNVRLGAAAPDRPHPLTVLTAAGVRCSISTDDPAIFDVTLAGEYAVAARLGVDAATAYASGLAGALCADVTRDRLAALGRRAYGPAAPVPRTAAEPGDQAGVPGR